MALSKTTDRELREEGIKAVMGTDYERKRGISKEQINAAYELLATGMPKAAGYRILIKPLEATKQMEAKEAEKYSHLAAQGFEVKTENQKERETRGIFYGIVVHIGSTAYDRLGEPWAKVGDVVIFHRYTGVRHELPPGSGEFYQFINDEDIHGILE